MKLSNDNQIHHLVQISKFLINILPDILTVVCDSVFNLSHEILK